MRTSNNPLQQRAAGLLLHPTSLPGPHGCGDLGRAARRFADFLAAAGLSWWQMLPVNPPGPGNSPYSAYSAFAGSPLLVNLDALVAEGRLTGREVQPETPLRRGRVDYPATRAFRESRLRRAFANSRRRSGNDPEAERFSMLHAGWLPQFALFCALRKRYGPDWTRWPAGLRSGRPAELARAAETLREEIAYHEFVQCVFFRQWAALRDYCRARGVRLLGDVPIFVAHQSSDVWSRAELFELRPDGGLKLQSGVPPDDFSRTGQLWRHPLYRWPRHIATGFRWWIERFRATLALFDAVRVDHFLGFHQCWAVPGRDRIARGGRYLPTPGAALLTALRRSLGGLPIVAEDLGAVTDEALALRDRFELPGMRILHWAFGDGPAARYNQPHNFPRNCIVYTGTHDNDTTVGWWRSLAKGRRGLTPAAGRAQRERLRAYGGASDAEPHWSLIRLALASPAVAAIVPVQDVLGLDSRHRMNLPATARGNWEWRLAAGALTPAIAKRLRRMTDAYERSPGAARDDGAA